MDIQIYSLEPSEFERPRKKFFGPVIVRLLCGGLLVFAAVGFGARYVTASTTQAVGGPDTKIAQVEELTSEERIRRLRTKQAVLSRREEMLRYQLQQMEEAQRRTGSKDSSVAEQLRRSRNTLVMLLKDQEDTDEQLVEFLRQVWEADGRAHVETMGMESNQRIVISWPVEPRKGVSADFGDPYYFQKFGIAHEAVDIPVKQGSDIKAAAPGVVSIVTDNGLGYNYIIVRHDGFATLYGHISEFTVAPGDEVQEGDIIAKSGGAPGTRGAGALTTGPHLHFELLSGGSKIDPMPYLPYSSSVKVVREWNDEASH